MAAGIGLRLVVAGHGATVITRRPAAEAVSSDSATDISATLRFSNSSSKLQRSLTERVNKQSGTRRTSSSRMISIAAQHQVTLLDLIRRVFAPVAGLLFGLWGCYPAKLLFGLL
jgi:hypothetical protein